MDPLHVEITFEERQPPKGSLWVVGSGGSAEHRFEGWLGLLRALADGFVTPSDPRHRIR